ncbi:glycosyltransferase family 39 protein [Leptolyngbya sp. FACHB-261]|uniref:ArnT family glycosyltransferase n=1 Tax=Leptolyngbya sp. FACHB-261 TaxID=2692806 RepID=UPI00168766D7|nr:glycosyltransferase family 39 protein [Leptolyngbya sp. FACHB-261]MBD2103025.1 glycosyltransferase family 39 protein [Leptolyngbya sp. FACHB-261]
MPRQTAFEALLRYRALISFLILLLFCVFVFFWRLDAISLRKYDEARRAVNALEMTLNGNLLVTYFGDQPDLWGTKPPLLVWLMAGCMKLFGYNELAVRLPAAVCAMATTVILFLFSKVYLQSLQAALVSGFVLMTTYGFIAEHVARTGDYDAVLILWITVYSLAYFVCLNTNNSKKGIYLWAVTITLILAVWTKGIAGLLPLPGLFVYTLYRRKLRELLFSPQFYRSIVLFLLFALGYYVLREIHNPGYLKAISENELAGRYLNTLEGNRGGGFWFYLRRMTDLFIPWLYLLPICFLLTQYSNNRLFRQFGAFSLFYLVCHYSIISLSKTKIVWYSAPQYPIAALVIGLGIAEASRLLLEYYRVNDFSKRQLISGLLVASILLLPSARILRKIQGTYTYNRPQDPPELQYGYYFRQLRKTQPQLTHFSVVDDSHTNHLQFYTKAANLNGYSIGLVSPDQALTQNEVVVTCAPSIGKALVSRYQLQPLQAGKPCNTYKVVGPANPD